MVYVPDGVEVLAATLYQTVVVSLVAVLEVVFRMLGAVGAGTPAKVRVVIGWLLTAVVGPAPKPPTPSTR